MSIISLIAPTLKPYLSIDGIKRGETYRYEAREEKDQESGQPIPRRYPVVECRMHRPKHRVASIVYIAVRAGSDVLNLKSDEKLYVGSQIKADRMFRGDVPRGVTNFHHAEMRAGRNGEGLDTYLAAGGRVDIYLAEGRDLCAITSKRPEHANLHRLLCGQIPFTHSTHLKYQQHTGFWVEQLILRDELPQWAWNAKGPTRLTLDAFALANT